MNFFVLPGNPPARFFYEEWCREIQELHPSAKFHIADYPRFEDERESERAMRAVVRDLGKQFRDFHDAALGPVHLMGHSLGGYFALRLLREEGVAADKAFLLHPFLKQPTLRGRLILKTVEAVAKNQALKERVIASRRYFEIFSKDLGRVSQEELYRTFFLGRNESKTIAIDRRPLQIERELRQRLYLYYCQQDSWCPVTVVRELESQIFTEEISEPHNFITARSWRRGLFQRIAKHLS